MKRNVLLVLFASMSLLLTGCDGTSGDTVKDLTINVKVSEPLELTSDKSYPLGQKYFVEGSPVFVDGHIDHLVMPVYGTALMTDEVREGFVKVDIKLSSKSSGSLYFNIDSDAETTLKDSLRIELYEQVSNTSVIYSYNGGESLTEGTADMNGDNQEDIGADGNPIIYTTGEHSYSTEQFNVNPFITMQENVEVTIRAIVFYDGFTTNNANYSQSLQKLDFLFEVR